MKKIISISILILLFTGCSFEFEKKVEIKKDNNQSEQKQASAIDEEADIITYGMLSQFSTSGAMKFNYYDIENNKIINNNKRSWFWAGPDINDKIKLDSFVKYVESNKDSVFKITGKKESDDCGYIEGICFEDIAVTNIEVIKSD